MNDNRRAVLKRIGISAAWTTPIIQSIRLPAHAETSSALLRINNLSIDCPEFITGSQTFRLEISLTNISGVILTIEGALIKGFSGFGGQFDGDLGIGRDFPFDVNFNESFSLRDRAGGGVTPEQCNTNPPNGTLEIVTSKGTFSSFISF